MIYLKQRSKREKIRQIKFFYVGNSPKLTILLTLKILEAVSSVSRLLQKQIRINYVLSYHLTLAVD